MEGAAGRAGAWARAQTGLPAATSGALPRPWPVSSQQSGGPDTNREGPQEPGEEQGR